MSCAALKFMSDLPPDPRATIDQRIQDLKKRTQMLNLEALLAQEELDRAKKAVRDSKPRPA